MANIKEQFISRIILVIHGLHALSNKFLARSLSNNKNHMAILFESLLNKVKKSTFSFQIKGWFRNQAAVLEGQFQIEAIEWCEK